MNDQDTCKLFRLAKDSVVHVAQTLKHDLELLNTVNMNQGKDIKLEADRHGDEMLFTLLEPAGLAILSEESGSSSTNCLDGPCWIVDPLDGTFNYHRGFPAYAVSVALWDRGKPVFGIVHDIANGNNYSGLIGKSARCDGETIRVSDVNGRNRAVLATGFPSGRSYDDDGLRAFVRSIQAYKKIRMIGSAALSLTHVAKGVFDIYHEQDIWLWDVAAGLALVLAAGGKISTSKIGADWKLDVTAWNGNFEPEAG